METKITKELSTEFEYPVLDIIKNRRSIRAFSSKPVEEEKIKSLFEAARWAPSSNNEQPWMYVYATADHPLWNNLLEALNEGNRIWVKDAPLLVASLAKKTFSKNGSTNIFSKHDLGAANAFISLQAVALGLQIHQMAGYDKEKLRTILNISDDIETGSMMAIGYPGDGEKLPERIREREKAPRMRFKQNEFVFNRLL